MSRLAYATPPVGRYLTSLGRVKDELEITGSTYDTLLTRLVSEASDLVYWLMGRGNRPLNLFRSQYTETRRGREWIKTFTGLPYHPPPQTIMLSVRPVVSIDSVTMDGVAQTVSDFYLEEPDIGIVYRELGFAGDTDPDEWSFTYTAGYFLVGDDFSDAVSVAASDKSYNSAALFHPLLRPGDWINPSGFSNSANNGLRQVVTATTSKITVAETLVDEVSATHTIGLENVPPVYIRAAHDLIKGTFLARKRDGSLKSLAVGPVRYEWDREALNTVQRDLAPYTSPL